MLCWYTSTVWHAEIGTVPHTANQPSVYWYVLAAVGVFKLHESIEERLLSTAVIGFDSVVNMLDLLLLVQYVDSLLCGSGSVTWV